jgi:hypothetical protein
MTMLFFWVMAPCRLGGRIPKFSRNILSPSSGLKAYGLLPAFQRNVLSPPSGFENVMTQKTNIFPLQ